MTDTAGGPVLAIVGPTAAGKTTVSLLVAERLGGEVIVMDSRTVYRGMDVGTAKPGAEERRRVPHHGLDLVDPGERYSAGRFAREARQWIGEIRSRGRAPVLVGGTGFFLRALTKPLFEEPPLDGAGREELRAALGEHDEAELRRWLGVIDPATAERLSRGGGAQRLTRALEVALLTGRTLTWWHEAHPSRVPALEARVFVVSPPRAVLYDRINHRVQAMIGEGLAQEVQALLAAGYGPKDAGMSATGYPEMLAHLAGEMSLEQAVVAIQQATRRYARRQLTWFRNQLPPDAFWLDGARPAEALADEVMGRWRKTPG